MIFEKRWNIIATMVYSSFRIRKKGVIVMKNNFLKTILKSAVNIAVKNSANSTTSGTMFQPKAPVALKKFSKVENDK